MLQHGAYTLLMDSCYDREQFPTLEEAIDWCWASSKEEMEAVEFVLRKFFTLENGVYVQKRIQEEIAEYHAKSENNKRIAEQREANRRSANTNRERNVHESLPGVNEPPPNQEPITNNHKPKEKKTMSGRPDQPQLIEILNYLNQKAKREFRAVDSNLRLIASRLDEGASIDDCKAVIDAKVLDWMGDPKMEDYLRPETLFNSTKFNSYVGSLSTAKQSEKDWE